jgi:hypothetical protein
MLRSPRGSRETVGAMLAELATHTDLTLVAPLGEVAT